MRKTLKLEGAALEVAKRMDKVATESANQLKALNDQAVVIQTNTREALHEMDGELKKALGVGPDDIVDVDATYIADHGLAFVHIRPSNSLSEITVMTLDTAKGHTTLN